jgi:hypothetical protein
VPLLSTTAAESDDRATTREILLLARVFDVNVVAAGRAVPGGRGGGVDECGVDDRVQAKWRTSRTASRQPVIQRSLLTE